MTRVIFLCTFIVTTKMLLKGVGVFKISLKIAFILFANVLVKRFKFANSVRVLRFVHRFKLVLFIFYVNLRIKPDFFSSFGGKKVALGLLTMNVIMLGVTITLAVCFVTGNHVRLPVVINVLCNTMAGAPKLNTTRRTLARLGCGKPRVTLKCTYTCPLKMINVVNSVVIVHCLFHVGLTGRRRRLGGRSTRRVGRGPRLVDLRMHGRSVSNGELVRMGSFLKHPFIYSHVQRRKRIDVPGRRARFRVNSRIFVIYSRRSARTVVTFVKGRMRIS